ncbi:MAG: inositol monophosphatase family protein [Thermodesulfobacteriota bacterium]
MNLDLSFQLAMEAVLAAGKILKQGFHKKKPYQKKGAIDLVTEWDFKSQETILAILKSHFPDADYLVEESGSERRPSPYCWVLDPLDGTTNFVHGFPFFCVSLALGYENVPLLGIVYNPELKETYWALKGQGAFFNGRPLRVSPLTKVSQSLLATGFPYNIKKTHGQIIERFERVITRAQGVRRPGSAALDLCWVAKGVIDGFWEQYLKPWDTAAGLLLVEEAGGKVTDFAGHPYHIEKKQILATNGRIHQEMVSLLSIKNGPA